MGLIKLRCRKCGAMLTEDEIVDANVSFPNDTVTIVVHCWSCGANEEMKIPILNFLKLVSNKKVIE